MSSNIRIQRICQYCGKEFEARKTTTKTCSDNCAKRLYKALKRGEKIEIAKAETLRTKTRPIEELKAKEFLTVRDVATLLNCSLRTAYRLIEQGNINAVNIAQRKTLIRRSDIDKLFEQPTKA
jgi:excisionase family DNA binding protein